MARPQTHIFSTPLPHHRIQVLEVPDIPMKSMSVGQFSVMIPGLANQIVKENPGESLRVIIGFGHMFWLLAWHGKQPREIRPFETLEGPALSLPETEGDLWIHQSSTDVSLMDELSRHIEENLQTMTRPLEQWDSQWSPAANQQETVPDNIWIPGAEADFAKGCFLLLLRFHHGSEDGPPLIHSLQTVLKSETLGDQSLLRTLPLGTGQESGTLVLLFHQSPETLDDELEQWLEDDTLTDGMTQELTVTSAVRFFIPSLDILTGLRQGGIRMNKFSQTQQWKT